MTNKDAQQNDQNQECRPGESLGSLFEICVNGQLDSSWSDWFEGMEVKLLDNGQMMLCGTIIDQAALMGILNKLCGLNLTVISLRQVDKDKEEKGNKEI